MSEIIVLDGYRAPKILRSSAGSRSHTGGSTMSAKAKFKKVAKVCNKKKGKTARKACWRKHYRK